MPHNEDVLNKSFLDLDISTKVNTWSVYWKSYCRRQGYRFSL